MLYKYQKKNIVTKNTLVEFLAGFLSTQVFPKSAFYSLYWLKIFFFTLVFKTYFLKLKERINYRNRLASERHKLFYVSVSKHQGRCRLRKQITLYECSLHTNAKGTWYSSIQASVFALTGRFLSAMTVSSSVRLSEVDGN